MVGTAVTPGLGARLRRVVIRLLAGAGLAALTWLLCALLNSGTASAAQNSTDTHDTPHSTNGTDSGTGGGLLGGLLGGLGATLGNTLGNVTGTVSGITTTVTNVTTGVVSDVTDTLGTTVHTVTGIVAPATTQVVTTVGHGITPPANGSSASGSTTRTKPVATKPAGHPDPVTTPVTPQLPPPAAVPPTAPASHVTTIPVTAQRIAVQSRHSIAMPHHPLPDQPAPQPAPQPGPAPAVPVSFAGPGHGFHGTYRHTLGTPAQHDTAPSPIAPGVHSPESAIDAARDQGLPPTTPD